MVLTSAVLWLMLGYVITPEDWPAVSKPEQCECLDEARGPDAAPSYDAEALARTVREPQNAWSNLGYLAVAIWIFCSFRTPEMRWLAGSVAALGIGSLLYHASGSRALRHFDIAGMYWVYETILLLSLVSWRHEVRQRVTSVRVLRISAALLPFEATALTVFRNIRVFGFKPLHISVGTGVTSGLAAALLFQICIHRRDVRSWILLGAALTLLTVGLVLQIGDRPGGWWCLPGAPIQPHALWHLAGAGCLAFSASLLSGPDRHRRGRTR